MLWTFYVRFPYPYHGYVTFSLITFFFVYTQSNVKIVLFQTIQISIITLFSSISPIDRNISCATTPGQSWPSNDGKKVVIQISQSSRITGASPSDGLVSYPGHLLEKFYPTAEMPSVYSAAPADWAISGLVSLFNGISNFVVYLMPKLFSQKNSSGTI